MNHRHAAVLALVGWYLMVPMSKGGKPATAPSSVRRTLWSRSRAGPSRVSAFYLLRLPVAEKPAGKIGVGAEHVEAIRRLNHANTVDGGATRALRGIRRDGAKVYGRSTGAVGIDRARALELAAAGHACGVARAYACEGTRPVVGGLTNGRRRYPSARTLGVLYFRVPAAEAGERPGDSRIRVPRGSRDAVNG
jgi:hypothetical protein